MSDENYPILERGSLGKDVARLQTLLVSRGFRLSVDGEFGPGTERSVKEFQTSKGVLPSGIVFPETWDHLRESLAAPVQVPPPPESDELATLILSALIDCSCDRPDALRWASPLAQACNKYKISGRENLSGFIGTLVHESSHFHGDLSENLNYTPEALMRTWPARFPPHLAERFGRTPGHAADQRLIAVLAYGGRMGNAPHPSLEGWDFRGRGPIQITGKDNYHAFSRSSGIDVLNDPELVLTPPVGAASSAWFWTSRNCDEFASSGDWKGMRKAVNGGHIGLDECIKYTKIALRVF